MKTIKSAQLGTRQLIQGNQETILLQLKEIIKEHRSVIITRLTNDLLTYLDYKFQMKPSRNQLFEIKGKLLDLKNGGVNLTHYQSIVNQIETKAVVHLTNEPFYIEIDGTLSAMLSNKELAFNQQN
jgi:hypothetical protein